MEKINGWISPEGIFVASLGKKNGYVAQKIVHLASIQYEISMSAADVLLERGWAVLENGQLYSRNLLTEEQKSQFKEIQKMIEKRK